MDGRTLNCSEKHYAWKGDRCSYVAKHMWILRHYGKATKCENAHCNYPNPKRYEWANISGEYKRNINDYRMLCPSCHRKFDYGNKCKNGHEYNSENSKINNRGERVCMICMKETWKRFRQKNRNKKCNIIQN